MVPLPRPRNSRLPVPKPRHASAVTLPPQAAAAAQELLGPLVLYRRVLRSHRKLPKEMRVLGDEYVKAEFRRCRKIENPLHLIGFLSQWKTYSDDLSGNTGTTERLGRPLGEILDKLSAEQLGQLHELMQATREVWRPPAEGDAAPMPTSPTPDDEPPTRR